MSLCKNSSSLRFMSFKYKWPVNTFSRIQLWILIFVIPPHYSSLAAYGCNFIIAAGALLWAAGNCPWSQCCSGRMVCKPGLCVAVTCTAAEGISTICIAAYSSNFWKEKGRKLRRATVQLGQGFLRKQASNRECYGEMSASVHMTS